MLIRPTDTGLACAAGGFQIDPWRPAATALITHAHADHARPGSGTYYTAGPGVGLLRKRLGDDADIRPVDWGERLGFGATEVSFHPAGHVLGSAQIRVESAAGVWVVSGDYKRDADPTCTPFEVVPCDTFVTEATFALPVYRWRPGRETAAEIHEWWQGNAAQGRPSVLFCYALGKAQRVLAELMAYTDRTVFVHGAVEALAEVYRDAGIAMLPTSKVDLRQKRDYAGELIIAPPGAAGTTWMRRFRSASTGFCSGWMRIRGQRRRRGYDRGFVLSDHADWPSLLATIGETGASRVLATHGHTDALVRLLRERGVDAAALETAWEGDSDQPGDDAGGDP